MQTRELQSKMLREREKCQKKYAVYRRKQLQHKPCILRGTKISSWKVGAKQSQILQWYVAFQKTTVHEQIYSINVVLTFYVKGDQKKSLKKFLRGRVIKKKIKKHWHRCTTVIFRGKTYKGEKMKIHIYSHLYTQKQKMFL